MMMLVTHIATCGTALSLDFANIFEAKHGLELDLRARILAQRQIGPAQAQARGDRFRLPRQGAFERRLRLPGAPGAQRRLGQQQVEAGVVPGRGFPGLQQFVGLLIWPSPSSCLARARSGSAARAQVARTASTPRSGQDRQACAERAAATRKRSRHAASAWHTGCLPLVVLLIPLRAIRLQGGARQECSTQFFVIVTAVSRFRLRHIAMVRCGNFRPGRKAQEAVETARARPARRKQVRPLAPCASAHRPGPVPAGRCVAGAAPGRMRAVQHARGSSHRDRSELRVANRGSTGILANLRKDFRRRAAASARAGPFLDTRSHAK
ncbi:MAG TPA: hypothetical protein VN279_15955 [Rhodocyclaceae bacterium]|nr:hypothetical protein [Rhodocyclaceae bacterium]